MAALPHVSVLDPVQWNVMYNGGLSLAVPEETTIVIAKHLDDVEVYATETQQ